MSLGTKHTRTATQSETEESKRHNSVGALGARGLSGDLRWPTHEYALAHVGLPHYGCPVGVSVLSAKLDGGGTMKITASSGTSSMVLSRWSTTLGKPLVVVIW